MLGEVRSSAGEVGGVQYGAHPMFRSRAGECSSLSVLAQSDST